MCALAASSGADAQARRLGAGGGALTGYHRVPVVASTPRGLLLTGGLGYGFTEGQLDAPGSHHRMDAKLAAALTPLDGLDLSVRTNFRHDAHARADASGTDEGTAIDSEAYAQLGAQVARDYRLGAGLAANFVGGVDIGSSLSNPALTGQLLAAFAPAESNFSLGLLAGFRYDRSAQAVLGPESYRAGDRLALGLSDFNAFPVGLGAAYRWSDTEVLAELSADLLVGSGSPDLDESPLRASAGARHHLSDALALRLIGEAALSARPRAGPADPLTPVEPRFSLLVGMAYAFPSWDTPPSEPAPPAPAPAPTRSMTRPEPPKRCSLVVNVTTEGGFPLSDAVVELTGAASTVNVPHHHIQSYQIGDLPCERVMLRVTAPRLEPHSRAIVLGAGEARVVEVQLAAAVESGQLRGLIRSFGGQGLQAKIRIEPIGTELVSDAAGSFVVDLPPGRYRVVVDAPGHVTQRREIEVSPDGVIVLNADLIRESR